MTVSEGFSRPIGGDKVASDLALYVRELDDVACAEVSCEAGRSRGDAVNILAFVDPIEQLKHLSAASRSPRKRFRFEIEMSSTSAVSTIEISVSWWWTRITITGLNRKVTGGEKREIARVLRKRAARQFGAAFKLLITGLLALATITGVLIAMHFKL